MRADDDAPMDRRTPLLPPVFRGSDAVAEGLLTPDQLRGPLVRRVVRGVYAPARVPITHVLRCAGAGLVLEPRAQLTGPSMATVLGVPMAGPDDDVSVIVPEDSSQERYTGIVFRRVSTPWDDGTPWETTSLASPARMGFDLAARVPLPVGVARLDAVVRAGLVTEDALRAWALGRRDHGIRRVRQALELVDPRAESQPESVLRVHLRLAGLVPVPQHVVRSGRRVVARVDLAFPEQRVAVEYDGAWHALREQLDADRVRMTSLRDAGWVVVHVTAAMLRDPGAVVATVRRALAAAA